MEALKNKISQSMNTGRKYYIIVFFCLLIYFLLFLSPVYLPQTGKTFETPMGSTLKLTEETAVTLESWTYDPEKAVMEVQFTVEDLYNNYRTVLSSSAISRKNLLMPLPVQTVLENREIFIVHIQDIPKKFEAISLSLKTENSNKAIKFYSDMRTIETSTITVQSESMYQQTYVEREIKKTEKSLADNKETISKLQEEIKTLKADITHLGMVSDLLTIEEIQERDRICKQKEGEISLKEKNISEEKARQIFLQEKLKKLKRKLESVGNQ